jgi:S1-C subfamily serine protease
VFADDLILSLADAVDDDSATVRRPDGNTVEGQIVGRAFSTGLAVIRVSGLGIAPLALAPDPRVGHLAVAVGRTWSGGVFATVTTVAVIGGPLRTSRTSEIERVIRVAHAPHGALVGGALIDGQGRALGIITGSAIRRTTVVLPGAIAWDVGQQLVAQGGTKRGFLGVSSAAVSLPARQRAGRDQEFGLLISAVVADSPADAAGLLVGDVIVAFDGVTVQEPESLVTMLRGDRVGRPVKVTVLRGGELRDLDVTVGERPKGGSREGRRR